MEIEYKRKRTLNHRAERACGYRSNLLMMDIKYDFKANPFKEKDGKRHFEVNDAECVACNLCVEVCPVDNCITMVELPKGQVDPRTGRKVGDYADWTTHPNNPMAAQAAD